MRKITRVGLDAIESYFKMPFKNVINILHLQRKETILSLSQRCKISRDTFQRNAKRLNLKLRNPNEARAIVIENGKCSKENHWAFGLRKNKSDWALMHSLRMKKNNPTKNKLNLIKANEKHAERFKNNPTFSERKTYLILKRLNVNFEEQKTFDKYIIDFFITDFNICLEIGSDKRGKERLKKMEIRTLRLNKLGYKVLFVANRQVCLEYIHDILVANDVI